MGHPHWSGGGALGQIIASYAPDIARRWLEQVHADLVETPDGHPTPSREGLSDHLAAFAGLLSRSGRELVDGGGASWACLARNRGITCVRNGFDIAQLFREFIALRHAIRDVAIDHVDPNVDAGHGLVD
jgi:hypothetical protein